MSLQSTSTPTRWSQTASPIACVIVVRADASSMSTSKVTSTVSLSPIAKRVSPPKAGMAATSAAFNAVVFTVVIVLPVVCIKNADVTRVETGGKGMGGGGGGAACRVNDTRSTALRTVNATTRTTEPRRRRAWTATHTRVYPPPDGVLPLPLAVERPPTGMYKSFFLPVCIAIDKV